MQYIQYKESSRIPPNILLLTPYMSKRHTSKLMN